MLLKTTTGFSDRFREISWPTLTNDSRIFSIASNDDENETMVAGNYYNYEGYKTSQDRKGKGEHQTSHRKKNKTSFKTSLISKKKDTDAILG